MKSFLLRLVTALTNIGRWLGRIFLAIVGFRLSKLPSTTLHFVVHLLPWAPGFIIAVTCACNLAPALSVILFAVFAANTLSLETCIACTIRKSEELNLVQTVKDLLYKLDRDPLAAPFLDREGNLKRRLVIYVVLTSSTAASWGLVSYCEIEHLRGQPISEYLAGAAALFSLFNVYLAITKLFEVSTETSFEHLLTNLVGELAISDTEPKRTH